MLSLRRSTQAKVKVEGCRRRRAGVRTWYVVRSVQMAATPSVRVVKHFPYRSGTKVWSNRYHFAGGTPADASHWYTLFDAITAAEKAVHASSVVIESAYGYAAGSDVPVASKTYSLAGTAGYTGNAPCPGDCAVVLRWSTAARSTKNHPVYLFNYFHQANYTSGSSSDPVLPAQITKLGTFAAAWITGFSDGTNTYVRAGPNGAVATGSFVDPYISHRDFPR